MQHGFIYTLAQQGLPQADAIAQTYYDIHEQDGFRYMVVRHSQVLCYAVIVLRGLFLSLLHFLRNDELIGAIRSLFIFAREWNL